MGYFIRVLGAQDPDIFADELTATLAKAGHKADLDPDDQDKAGRWAVLDVRNEDGALLTQIERNLVQMGCLGQAELDEFRGLIRAHQPLSAVHWLDQYFDRVRVIYAFRIMDAALVEDNFEIVSALKTAIWGRVGGLIQNDEEGFTNDEGYHILWQFPEEVTGDKYCAVLDGQGKWQRFRMDLGDAFQRMAFWAGEVPQMAVRL